MTGTRGVLSIHHDNLDWEWPPDLFADDENVAGGDGT